MTIYMPLSKLQNSKCEVIVRNDIFFYILYLAIKVQNCVDIVDMRTSPRPQPKKVFFRM